MLALFQSLFVWLSWCRSKLFRLVDDPKWTWWWPYAWGLKAAPPSSSSSSSSSSPSSSASTGLPAVVTLRPSAPPPRRHGSAHTQGPQGQGHSQRGRTRWLGYGTGTSQEETTASPETTTTNAESYASSGGGKSLMLRFSAFFSKSLTSALDLLSIKDKLASTCSRAGSAVTAISNALRSSFVSHFSLDLSVLKDKLTTSYGIAANAVTSTCNKLCSAVSVSSFGSTLSHYKDVATRASVAWDRCYRQALKAFGFDGLSNSMRDAWNWTHSVPKRLWKLGVCAIKNNFWGHDSTDPQVVEDDPNIVARCSDPVNKRWYHGNISDEEAESRLRRGCGGKDGTYLVYDSPSSREGSYMYVLLIYYKPEGEIKKLGIKRQFVLENNTETPHKDVRSLIKHHRGVTGKAVKLQGGGKVTLSEHVYLK